MEDYFKKNPNEKKQIVKSIQENSIQKFKPSAAFLPSYLIHDETKDNAIAQVFLFLLFIRLSKRSMEKSRILGEEEEREKWRSIWRN